MNAGIYLVTNKIEEKKYLISINGVNPFLSIDNAISLADFANGIIKIYYLKNLE